jgi:hypothetical protein
MASVENLIVAVHAASPGVEPPPSEPVKALTAALMSYGLSNALAATVADRFALSVELGVSEAARVLSVTERTLKRDHALVAEVAAGSRTLRERLRGEVA